MRILRTLLSLLMLSANLFAQDDTNNTDWMKFQTESNIIEDAPKIGHRRVYWDAQPLEWADFDLAGEGDSLPFQFAFEMGYDDGRYRYKDSMLHYYATFCYLDQINSYVQESEQTELNLRFLQAVFDTYEINRRRMQKAMYGITKIEQAEEIHIVYRAQTKKIVDALYHSIYLNGDTSVLDMYEWEILAMFKETHDIEIPRYKLSPLRLGIFIGVNTDGLSSPMSGYFNPAGRFQMGAQVSVKKFVCHFFFNVGSSLVATPFNYDLMEWPSEVQAEQLQFEFGLGYKFNLAKFLSLKPYAGYAYNQINLQDGFSNSMDSHSWHVGLDIDLKLGKHLYFFPINGDKYYAEWPLKLRIYASGLSYVKPNAAIPPSDLPNLNGVAINVGFCFGFEMSKLRMR